MVGPERFHDRLPVFRGDEVARCPSCGVPNNAVADAGKVGSYPKEDDWSVCAYCGDIGLFTGNRFEVRKATDEERAEALAAEGMADIIATGERWRREPERRHLVEQRLAEGRAWLEANGGT